MWLSAGVRWDRDVSINPDRVGRSSSTVASTDLWAYDERSLLGIELRSSGFVDIDTDLEDSSRDYQDLFASSGPVFALSPTWDLHTALGGRISFYDQEVLSWLGAVYLAAEHLETSSIRSLNLDFGFERVTDEFDGDDAPWVDVYATFGADDLTPLGLSLSATPLLEHYQADQSRFRYTQAELRLDTVATVWNGLDLTVSVRGWRRWYYGSEIDVNGRRRDWLLTGELSLMLSELWLDPLAIELRGVAEKVWSNDSFEDEDTESVGLHFHWRF